MAGSVPARVTNYSDLISALSLSLSRILAPPPPKYAFTWDRYKINLLPTIPQKLVSKGKGDRTYQIIMRASEDNCSVALYLGDDGEKQLSENPTSAWQISGKGGWIAELGDVDIWAISDKNCSILVDIQATIINPSKEMPAPLSIVLEVPTGSDFYLPQPFAMSDGTNYLIDKLDSELGIDGHKFFTFNSFDPLVSQTSGYQFNVKVDPNFTTIDSSSPNIEVHLFNLTKLGLSFTYLFAGWGGAYLGLFPSDLTGEIKRGNWAAGVTAPSSFVLRPTNLKLVGMISVKVRDVGWKSAVVDYNPANTTFTILGF